MNALPGTATEAATAEKTEKTKPQGRRPLADSKKGNVTRRALLKAGASMTAIPVLAIAAPSVLAQAPLKSPTKVHDFMTNADVAKAEQEGQLVFYCHENEPGTAGIMEGFRKDFPKINTSYVRAQTGALYNKILSERSGLRSDVAGVDRKSTRLNSSHANISYAVFCLKK